MFLRPLRVHLPISITIVMIVLMMTQNVKSKPQGPSEFERVASQAIAVAGNMAEMAGNAGMMSKKMGFEMPFSKANSETKIATGAAMRKDDDDSSEEDRRKRSIDPQAFDHHHYLHRGKRSPCHTLGGGTGGGTGGGVPDDGDVITAEDRRRAYARKRKAAAKKAKKNNSNTNRKKKLISDDDDAADDVKQILTRRKRQSEVDDLNQNMKNIGVDFSQQAQLIAEKFRILLGNFTNSMNDLAQKLTQHFNGQSATNTMEI